VLKSVLQLESFKIGIGRSQLYSRKFAVSNQNNILQQEDVSLSKPEIETLGRI